MSCRAAPRHCQPRRLAALGFAADLHHHALAFIEPPAARSGLALRQKRRPIAADIDEDGAERRQQSPHSAEIDAAGLGAVAALDIELDRDAILEQRRAPLAGPGSDHQLAGQFGRYPWPASNCAVSNSGSPTTFE